MCFLFGRVLHRPFDRNAQMGDRGLAPWLCGLSSAISLRPPHMHTCIYVYVCMYIYIYIYMCVCVEINGPLGCEVRECMFSGTAALHCPSSAFQLAVASFIAGQGLDKPFPFA